MTRRTVIYSLVVFLVCALILESAFRFIDPAGIVRYFSDLAALSALSLPAPEGHLYAPGVHRFSMYTAFIGGDGLRTVQNGNGGECIIAFVGDSVVFGMGSDVSFVDYLAPDLPATVINAGIPGYNVGNVARSIDMTPAEGYIWLIIQNDDEPAAVWKRPMGGGIPSALSLYLNYWLPDEPALPRNEPYFIEMAAPVLSRSDVLAFVFDNQALTEVVKREFPQVKVIPNYTHTVSRFDAHPNPAGAAEIADSMRDAVTPFEAQQCAGTL